MSFNLFLNGLTKPVHGPDVEPLKTMSVLIGSIMAVTAVAGAVFGTLTAAESTCTLAFSACFIFGGATGYMGVPLVALIVGLGILFALPPQPMAYTPMYTPYGPF